VNLQESIRRILKEETNSVKNLNESKTTDYNELIYSINESNEDIKTNHAFMSTNTKARKRI
jgi:hypothetical protein